MHTRPFKMLILLLSALALLSGTAAAQGDGNLHIYAINVGDKTSCFYKQGDSTLIVSPNGTRMLIDGGAAGICGADQVIETFQRVIPEGGMDYMVTTHWDPDHSGGMVDIATYNSNQYMPTKIYDTGGSGGASYDSTFAGSRVTPSPGDVIDLGGGVTATVVCVNGYIIGGGYVDPLDIDNARSIGLLIQFGEFDYLTVGDLEGVNDSTHRNTEVSLGQALVNAGYHVDILHAGHHGSRFSSTNEFLEMIQPEFAVISFGLGNIFGHPTQEAINHLNALDDDGDEYLPEYPPVTTIYMTEVSGNGTASNAKSLQSDPDAGGSIHIAVDSSGCIVFSNEGPGTNSFEDGPYSSDTGPPCAGPGPGPGPGPIHYPNWPVYLRVNKNSFSPGDAISIKADFYPCTIPFIPYIRLKNPSGGYMYIQRTLPDNRTKTRTDGPQPFRSTGPYVLDFTLDYYPVLDAIVPNVQPGLWTVEAALLNIYGDIIPSSYSKALRVD